jgi:hypothetical protein
VTVNEDDVLAFVAATIKSVWALELLLLMRRQPDRDWEAGGLVRELRASTVAVRDALTGLRNSGLVTTDDSGLFRYRPASEQLDAFAAEAESLYRSKPLSVINAIATAPNEKLRIFAEAFRLKE